MSIYHLVVTYGYLAVCVLVLAESFGVPIPGETSLIAAGTYAGATHRLSVWAIFAVAAAAAIAGGLAGYWIGDTGGYHLLRRWGKAVHFDEPKMKVARYLFDRHGVALVFFGRFVSVLRTYTAFLAGTARMRFDGFLVANVASGLVWSACYAFGAYLAGSTLKAVSTPLDIGFGVAAVVVMVAAVVVVHRHLGRFEERAETAYPGPLAP